ncbi:MAG: hypothetical protein KAR44_07245 [Candidatus Aegiribacteria sp.]|nr:hypothetical protein [Candidatus Aegiribacteria sp.]
MADTTLIDWLSLNSLVWSLFRIAIIWLAFYGAGSLIMRIRVMNKYFRLMPSVIPGMLIYMGAAVLLSLLHILTRNILPILIVPGALTGLIILYVRLKKSFPGFSFHIRHPIIILPALLAGYILITNLMLAGRPEMEFNDTQVTYLVQPDRWLNEGQISFLDETVFSAFPMTSEMLLLMPSSLAVDRVDQLILGQLFELSMTIALILLCMAILGFGWKWYPAALISITGCSTVLLWCHFAKPDATALFFITVALTILLKQMMDKEYHTDLSAFAVMGLALTSKMTVYIALIPFIIMYTYIIIRNKPDRNYILSSIILMAVLPLIFALRTFIHTGALLYPYTLFKTLLKPQWQMPLIHLTYNTFNNRSSDFYPTVGIIQNLWHYFGTWNSSVFLLLGGFILTVKRKCLTRRAMIFAGFSVYATISLILFYPAWWGAKYGIMLIPFATLFGLYMFRYLKHGLLFATILTVVIYFIYDTSLSPTEHYGLSFRNRLVESYVIKDWRLSSCQIVPEQPELEATLWMNNHIPSNSTILSFYATKRYFSNHRWINSWRYPLSAYIYLDNSITDEIEILKQLDIDYVILGESDPAPFDDENQVELFSRIGRGDVLEPVANIDGYTIFKFCPLNL